MSTHTNADHVFFVVECIEIRNKNFDKKINFFKRARYLLIIDIHTERALTRNYDRFFFEERETSFNFERNYKHANKILN